MRIAISPKNDNKNDRNDNVGFQIDPRTLKKTQEQGINHLLGEWSK